MTEQELKERCTEVLKTVPLPSNEQERIRVATDFAERLFIADYFSKENRTNFTKNELCSYFELTSEKAEKIIEMIDAKENLIKEKLQISKFKDVLHKVKVYDEDNIFFRGNNILEVKKIVEYIQTNYTFTNKEIFKTFVKDDLCHYFSLTDEEVKEIMELI